MNLLNRVDRYLRDSKMARTRFGRATVNDPRLVDDMRRGRVLQPHNRARVAAFLDRAEAELAVNGPLAP